MGSIPTYKEEISPELPEEGKESVRKIEPIDTFPQPSETISERKDAHQEEIHDQYHIIKEPMMKRSDSELFESQEDETIKKQEKESKAKEIDVIQKSDREN